MPSLPISLSSLSGLLNIAPSKAADATNANGFIALLNVGNVPQDAGAPAAQPDNNPPPRHDNTNSDTPQPQAVYVQAPLPPAPRPNADTHAPAGAPSPSQNSSDNTSAVSASNGNTSSPATAPAAPTGTISQTVQPTTDGSQNATLSEKQLRVRLEDVLGNISQLLMSIMQSVAGAAAVTGQPVIAPTDTTAAAPDTTTTSTDTSSATTGITSLSSMQLASVVQDMQALLAQLQQMMAGGTSDTTAVASVAPQTQSTTASTSATDSLQTLTASLQKDMSGLLAFLQSQQPAPVTTAPVTTQPAVQTDNIIPAANPSDLKSQLLASVAKIKDQLQQIKSDNEAAYATAKTNFQNALASFAPLQVSNNQNAKDTSLPQANVQATTTTTDITAAPIVPNSFVEATSVAVQFNVTPATSTENSGGNAGQNNNGGGGQPPQGITPLAAGQAQAAGGAMTATFSKALAQVSQGSLPEQVAVNVKTALSDGSSRIRIQLDPADLGKLDIKLNVGADGKTGIVITADHQSTLDLLHRDAPDLMRALNDMGLQTDSSSLSFNLRGGDQQGQQSGNLQGALTYQKAQPEEDILPVNVINRSYVVNLAEGLDIKI